MTNALFRYRSQCLHLLTFLGVLFSSSCFQSVTGEQPAASFQNTVPNPEVALEAAVLSHEAFLFDGSQSENTRSSSQYEIRDFIKTKSGVQILITTVHDMKTNFVTFRGSDELKDWSTNFNAIQTRLGPITNTVWSAGLVHSGYDKVLFHKGDALIETVLDTLNVDDIRSYDLVFSGHSKGGGEALLFASYVCSQELKEKECLVITFGQPMVGNEEYVNFVDSLAKLSVWRFVMSSDPVPRLPPRFYDHAGHLVQLEEQGAKAYYRHYGEDALGLAGAPRDWEDDVEVLDPIEKHKMTGYIDYMMRAVQVPKVFYVDAFEEFNECDKLDLINKIFRGCFLP